MAKKSFKDALQQRATNPTLQFVSASDDPEPVEDDRIPARADRPASAPTRRPAAETKSRRLQLLLTPSLYEAIRETAAEEGISVNEFINATLWETIRRE